MPNHVATITTFSCNKPAVLEKLKQLIWREDSFDFNSVLPSPEELKDSVSPSYICSKEDKANKYKDDPQYITKSESEWRIDKFGAVNWYDWNCNNWGVKWNAYGCSIVESHENILILKYDTAWDAATPVLREISRRFPNVAIVSEYADEGGGFVCRDTLKDNSLARTKFDWNSEDGIEIRNNVGYGPQEDEDEEG